MYCESFYTSKQTGDKGELWMQNYFKLIGKPLHRVDTEAYRQLDIDFIDFVFMTSCNNKDKIINHNMTKYEVKTDNTKFKNQILEIISNNTKNTKGWTLITEANYIVSVFALQDIVYVYDAKMLKAYAEYAIQHNLYDYKHAKTKSDYDDKVYYQSTCIAVPHQTLIDNGIVKTIIQMSTNTILYDAFEEVTKAVQ